MEQLMELLLQYPTVMKVVMLVGTLRLVLKPIMVAVESIVLSTPTLSDDSLLAKVKANPIYKVLVFVVDWLGSVKLPK
jgi:hypothetical protein